MKISILIIAMLIQFSCCSQNDNDLSFIPISKKSSVKNYKLKTGISEGSFTMTNGKQWNFKIRVPEIIEGEKMPLILALHWAGRGNTYKEYADCLAFPAFKDTNAIIIAPSGEGVHWINEYNEKRLVKLIRQIIKLWEVDSDKVIVTGYSNGGIGSWFMAKSYPDLFTAAIPMAGFYKAEKIKIPLYVLHGEKDELFDVDNVKKAIAASVDKGSDITFKELPSLSHYQACSYVDALKNMALLIEGL